MVLACYLACTRRCKREVVRLCSVATAHYTAHRLVARKKDGSVNKQIQPSKGGPLFNPWSPEFIANPYPSYDLLRETEPMHYRDLRRS